MSYILDALRRADAERERGAVPDLNAQPLALTPVGDDTPARSAVPWAWLGAGAALALAVVALWQFMGADAPAPVAVAEPAQAPIAAAQPLPAAPPLVVPPLAAPPLAGPVAAPVPATPSAPARRPVPPPRPAVAVSKPAPLPVRVPKLAELPPELRQSVPQLAVGGSVFSPQAASRMVIVNGQVFREGDTLAPGLKLEQIRAKSAVFSIRGERFELPF